MKKYKLLILTDHSGHSKENSLYDFVQKMITSPFCEQVDIATRAYPKNDIFFKEFNSDTLHVTTATKDFYFDEKGSYFNQNIHQESIYFYDLIWLRLPPPLSSSFLEFLQKFKNVFIINHPKGIYITGSKEFLTRFPECCPPLKICRSIEDIITFKNQFPIVLKPFREYGGRGILKIEGEQVYEGNQQFSFSDFVESIKNKKIEYLGVKFLKNVSQGDKRIIVVHGKIMGASVRIPAKDSWLCNVAMGGSSQPSQIEPEEEEIVKIINPILSEMGIVMYGIDTLVNDDGKRVLSEINTTSIGGLPQIASYKKLPLVEETMQLIWEYFLQNKINNDT